MKTLDLRNMPCPQPVVACRNFLMAAKAQGGTNTVDGYAKNAPENPFVADVRAIVDNEAAAENVQRFLEQQGLSVVRSVQGKDFHLTAQGVHSAQDAYSQAENASQIPRNGVHTTTHGAQEYTLVFITTETLGRGDDDLGTKLMATFLSTLPELGESLWRVILLNGGVKLAAQKGPALEHLRALEEAGVRVLVCGTCLAHYGLMEHKQIGETSNMLDIVTSLQRAEKVIRP